MYYLFIPKKPLRGFIFTTTSDSMGLGEMADQVDEPLIVHGYEDYQDVDNANQGDNLEENLRRPGLFVWLLTFSAGISGLLFGCEY
jgi:hypothetical protein